MTGTALGWSSGLAETILSIIHIMKTGETTRIPPRINQFITPSMTIADQ